MTPSPEPEHPTVDRTGVLADDPSAPRTAIEHRWAALGALMTVSSDFLAPLVRVAPLDDGVTLTHRLPAGSVPLADLRAAGPLRAGHVLAVALAVAEALVDLERHDLAHGGVRADHVVVGPDGDVLLAGCGLDWRRAPSDVGGPRTLDDVAAVGELIRDLLGTGSSPSSLVLAALRASDADSSLRPTPAELCALLRRCGRAEPLLDLLWRGSASQQRDSPFRQSGLPSPPREARDARAPRSSPAARLRIDPRSEPPVPDEVVVEAPDEPAGADRPRRPGFPPRPTGRERRTRRRSSGPLRLGLVTMLALLVLGVVRVGALARADGPAAEAAASATSSSAVAVVADSRSTTAPDGTPSTRGLAATAGAPAASPPSGSTREEAPLVLDRGGASAVQDWDALLAAADAGRAAAISAGDTDALRAWVDPAGPDWTADSALAARVSALHARVEGGSLVVLEVRPQAVSATRAVLLVRDRRSAYSVVTSDGTTTVDARAPRWWRVTMVLAAGTGGDTWRLSDVAPVAAPAT